VLTIIKDTSVTASMSDTLYAALEQSSVKDLARDADQLSEKLAELARKHRVPGAQLAIRLGGATVAVQAGVQRYETGHRVHPDAAFPLGSITKTFTATLAMILVADGDVELDVPLDEYLPEPPELGDALTLRQLLSHTGGLVSDAPEGPDEARVSIRRYVLDHCRRENLLQPPGTAFSYSNIGYVLAGHLIEVVTGMTWWDAMESILLRPLGIEPAFVVTPGHREQRRDLVTGHSVNISTARTRPVEQSLPQAMAPAGALAVSAMDLVALGSLQLEEPGAALLASGHAAQMRAAVPAAEPFGIADAWGLGLALFRTGDTVSAGHDGNAEGTACYLRVEPSSGCVVGFTSNAPTGIELWQDVAEELRAAGLPVADFACTTTGLQPSAIVPDCLGLYRNGDTEYAVDTAAGGGLGLLVDGEPVASLACYQYTGHGPVAFAQQDIGSGAWRPPGRFLREPVTGEIDRIQIDGRTARRQPRSAGDHFRC
jgi:CubicO group peptidase (beta-lactamase class C family)